MNLKDTVGTIVIYITHNCNLNCSYCLNHNNGACNKKDFDAEPDYLEKLTLYVNSLKSDMVHIVFFGGEPTLRWDVCKDIYYHLLQNSTKKLNFIIQTNGTTITDIIDDLKVMDKISVSLSLDADKVSHDTYRKYHDGKESWQDIKDNVLLLLNEGFMSRLTIACCCRFGDRDMFEKVKFLYEMGAQKVKTTFIKEVAITPEHMEIMLEEYKKISDYLVKHPDKLYYRFGKHTIDNEQDFFDDYQQHCDNNCTDMCRAGVYKIFVNTDGSIFPCHSLMKPHHLLGNIFDGSVNLKLAAMFDKFYNNCIRCEHKKGCIFCAYKVYYDTGSILVCNNIMKNSCSTVKSALEYYYDKCKQEGFIDDDKFIAYQTERRKDE